MREVPATVLVRGTEELIEAGVRNPTDLSVAFLGLTYSNANMAAQPAIRGVSTTASGGTVENPVAVYIDGIYQPNQTMNNSYDLTFVQNINVLKGLQGTMFGRNVVAGAILVTTKVSDLQKFQADAQVTLSTFGGGTSESSFYHKEALFLSAPIVQDRLAISLAGSMSHNSGYLKNVYPGSPGPLGTSKHRNLQAKLLWQPSDDVSFLLNYRNHYLSQLGGATVRDGVSAALRFPDAMSASCPGNRPRPSTMVGKSSRSTP